MHLKQHNNVQFFIPCYHINELKKFIWSFGKGIFFYCLWDLLLYWLKLHSTSQSMTGACFKFTMWLSPRLSLRLNFSYFFIFTIFEMYSDHLYFAASATSLACTMMQLLHSTIHSFKTLIKWKVPVYFGDFSVLV